MEETTLQANGLLHSNASKATPIRKSFYLADAASVVGWNALVYGLLGACMRLNYILSTPL